jgi:hypothetical protein
MHAQPDVAAVEGFGGSLPLAADQTEETSVPLVSSGRDFESL